MADPRATNRPLDDAARAAIRAAIATRGGITGARALKARISVALESNSRPR